MPHILKNKNLEVHIDLPDENYDFSRFDWTGKITKVSFLDIPVSTVERTDGVNENSFGKAFYNEFGIDTALGFDDVEIGGWFHKIGVGLLKKNSDQYSFADTYEIKPAAFNITTEFDRIVIHCKSESVAGYSYVLQKTITLQDGGFTMDYNLKNTGEKDIVTDEYIHNFTAINNKLMGSDYVLKFPFQLNPELFADTVNTEQKVNIEGNEIKFNGSPKEQFFFSNLTGNKSVDSKWDLINLKSNIGISESTNFLTKKINVWGWKHVISPELFYNVNVKPGQSAKWSRKYRVYKVN